MTNAIPAMKYDLDTRLKGKAEQRDLDHIEKDKASISFVEQVVKRLNKLEDQIRRKRGDDSGSDSDGSRSAGSKSHISEEDEDDSEDEEKRRKRQKKEKILKGTDSKPKLDKIEEEKEASVKSEKGEP